METLACRAVTQAGLVAVTASLDDHSPERLLFVAGWLTTAADLVPVLAERSRAVDAAVSELFPHLRRRGGRVVDPAGWHAGRRAADDAELGASRPSLADGR